MREIATYYSTFFILSTYISIVAVPLCLFLQKKNLINTKNSLGMIYSIIFSALLISVINPQSKFLISASEFVLTETVKAGLQLFRETIWNFLVTVFAAEPHVYAMLMSILGVACGVGAALYVLSLMVITIKIYKLEKFKKIGKLTILVDQENVTPHVFSFLRRSYVVVPKHVLEKKEFLKTAISHELQHIRNGDTHSIYLWQFFKCLLWINPFIHIILSYIKNLQELRVDENLIHEKKINYKVYLKTLSWFIGEGRQQSRYSLSHSIFGWSTFKELKMRITNIHRVRPMRSQPLFCLFFLAGNIFALLVIGNSSPKFQYSLYEVQRMYMPEYMKAEFLLKTNHLFNGPIGTESTLEFAKEKEIKLYVINQYLEQVLKKDPTLKEVIAKMYNKKNHILVEKDFFKTLNYELKIKVIEYSDEKATIQLVASHVDIKQLLLDKEKIDKALSNESYSSDGKKIIRIENTVNIRFNEEFEVDGVHGKFFITKKLSPEKKISFFPNSSDLVAEEKSSYESKL